MSPAPQQPSTSPKQNDGASTQLPPPRGEGKAELPPRQAVDPATALLRLEPQLTNYYRLGDNDPARTQVDAAVLRYANVGPGYRVGGYTHAMGGANILLGVNEDLGLPFKQQIEVGFVHKESGRRLSVTIPFPPNQGEFANCMMLPGLTAGVHRDAASREGLFAALTAAPSGTTALGTTPAGPGKSLWLL